MPIDLKMAKADILFDNGTSTKGDLSQDLNLPKN